MTQPQVFPKKLSPDESYVYWRLSLGETRKQIADDMEISRPHLAVICHNIKQKGYSIPQADYHHRQPSEKTKKVIQALKSGTLTNQQIAERFNITKGHLRVIKWRLKKSGQMR